MRLIIAGTRTFNDYELLRDTVKSFIGDCTDVEIVSGTAEGADKLGERFAEEFGYPVKRFPADWKLHGKAAGPIRNEQMAKYATDCICFWDGKSKGTRSMINMASAYKIGRAIIMYLNMKRYGNKRGKTGGSSSSVFELR